MIILMAWGYCQVAARALPDISQDSVTTTHNNYKIIQQMATKALLCITIRDTKIQ